MKYASQPISSSASDAPIGGFSNRDGEDSASEIERDSLIDVFRSWLRNVLRHKDTSLKEVLEEAIEEHEEQAEERLEPQEKLMLHNVLGFGDIKVNEIMTPRADISAVPSDITWPELKQHIIEMAHTRIPVYEDTLDTVLGFIHVKDLLSLLSGEVVFDIKSLMRPLLFVPPSMRIIDLLIRMRQVGSHMAMVVDEYGGTDGLVTMEDLFEEIVGDIHDEHDGDEDMEFRVHRISDTVFDVSARIPIENLERQLGLNLVGEENEGEFDTLGGLIFCQLGHVPNKGEIVQHASGIRFEVLEADPRRIRKVRILMAPSQ